MIQLDNFKSWRNISKETKEKFLKNSTYMEYTKGTVIYLESEQNPLIYLISSGYIVLSKTSIEGKEKYLYYLSTGDFINQCAIDGKLTATTAKVVSDASLISIDKDILLKLMKEDFELNLLILTSLTHIIRRSQRQILNLGIYNTSQRIASRLWKLSRDYGKKIDDYTLIDAPINQTDLSNMVGASRETVNRFLKELENKGIVILKGHSIIIIDRDRLLDYIN
ncbi:cAMP-binding domain of CRP or a regulatory subunit of cAMP-dependent protein kinases [Tissierella praeacuta DSM 18095]|uniref:cAMP-binding domain of CRP or a regulatory subunit of cAMP-dependent protein kinases n=1 Tax=Tissierella praeacuta DSM 18095 TaxID=1123404 RepID=A0A1M4XNN9_9FIRM|nr:Crp/Fnr family transcriptional regulator [Tissierella praeacuta]SHE95050.1 cAMP-binding domain of CRP or a regulatory subunit of cAMP-dependent protein kinases [Tissierella praeacuta DSM 18095]SUO99812.1 cAMP regulatory protein [Tissierella praeacuta]